MSRGSVVEEKIHPSEEAWSNMTLKQKVRCLYQNITLEPMIACFILPSAISGLAVQNLILEKACRVNLRYPVQVCDALTMRRTAGYKHEETAVQEAVAGMAVWTTVIQSLIPGVLVMFLGSWSDRTGKRKVCMLVPILGQLAAAVALILCTYFFEELPMRTTAFLHVFLPAVTGGWFTLSMGAYSFLAETSSVEMRTVRIGALSVFCSASAPFGTALSGVLIESVGFYGVFSMATLFYILAASHCCFRIKDVEKPSGLEGCEGEKGQNADPADNGIKGPSSLKNRDGEEGQNADSVRGSGKWWMDGWSLLKQVFDPTHFFKTLEVVFKTGSKKRRVQIILLIVVLAVVYGPFYGEATVMYLFMRYHFNWNEVQFSMFSTYSVITHLVGTAFSVLVFSHIMKMDDALIGILFCFSKILAGFVYAFARTDWQVYLAPLVDIINGTSFIAMRSIASKLVPHEELGKLNSLYGASEALTPLLYGPMYAFVYTQTLDVMPGAFFLLGGLLTLPALFIFCWMYNENRKKRRLPQDPSLTTGATQSHINNAFEHDLTSSEASQVTPH